MQGSLAIMQMMTLGILISTTMQGSVTIIGILMMIIGIPRMTSLPLYARTLLIAQQVGQDDAERAFQCHVERCAAG